MAGRAIGCHFARRTVASHTIGFRRHEQIRCLATRLGSMTTVAVQLCVRNRIDLMFGVIKIYLGHPSSTKTGLVKVATASNPVSHRDIRRTRRSSPWSEQQPDVVILGRILLKENRPLEFLTRSELFAQLSNLLRDKSLDAAFAVSCL